MPQQAPQHDLAALVHADKQHIIHPLHHPSTHAEPQVWASGAGSEITDTGGRTYLDGMAGAWCVNVGHGRSELVRAAEAQMETLAYASSYSGSSNPQVIRLAERLSGLTYPQINSFFFTSGGAESTESAIKTARYYWKARGRPEKTKFISREHAYHGTTLAAMSATGMSRYWPMFEPRVPGFLHIASPYPLYFNRSFTPSERSPTPGIAAANLLEDAILAEGPETVAAFIAEPVQGSGGVIVPQEDYFRRIREICDAYEVLLIADEVITGFGRTGKWFGLEHWGVQPDIMDFAKGVTSGYLPLGGIGISDAIRQALDDADPAQRWMHAYTYSGHPVASAVANANLDYFEAHDLVSHAAETGAHLQATLRQMAAAHPHVAEARGLGMMAALELVQDRDTLEPFADEAAVGVRLQDAAAERGLWVRARGRIFPIAPPLTTTRAEVERLVGILDGALTASGL